MLEKELKAIHKDIAKVNRPYRKYWLRLDKLLQKDDTLLHSNKVLRLSRKIIEIKEERARLHNMIDLTHIKFKQASGE